MNAPVITSTIPDTVTVTPGKKATLWMVVASRRANRIVPDVVNVPDKPLCCKPENNVMVPVLEKVVLVITDTEPLTVRVP